MTSSDMAPPYEVLADEYYDQARHPTCSNFGELSSGFLVPRIRAVAGSVTRALEVGAGRSILATVFEEEHLPLKRVTLLDQSAAMLRHSERWIKVGATSIVADARRTGLPDRAFDLIVSSLGDPYNCAEFWQEMHRVVSNSGIFLFTTPSFEWSSAFRIGTDRDKAEFVLRHGGRVSVPSLTRPLTEQRAMMAKARFVIAEEAIRTRKDLVGSHSPKLGVLHDDARQAVLYCFSLRPIVVQT